MSSRLVDYIDSITSLSINNNDIDEEKNMQNVLFDEKELPLSTHITTEYWMKNYDPKIQLRVRLLAPHFFLAHKFEYSSFHTLGEFNESILSLYPHFKTLTYFLSYVRNTHFSFFKPLHLFLHHFQFIIQSPKAKIKVIPCFFLFRSQSLIRTTFTIKIAIVSAFEQNASKDDECLEQCLNMSLIARDLLTQADFFPANDTIWEFSRQITPLYKTFLKSRNDIIIPSSYNSSYISNLKHRSYHKIL